MSYTINYNSSLKVSGSVRVSYPASEHGGTLTEYYNDVVPVTLAVTVATDPLDVSVKNAGHCVDGLTASIAAVNAASCANIAECSDKISDRIVSGFYGLIQNDITTKKAETKAEVQTKVALLAEHSKAVRNMHTRMLKDVERERAKYGNIIKELDTELQRRITELDKSAFNLSRSVRGEVINTPYLKSAAETADLLSAGNNNGCKVAAVSLRQKVSAVLSRLYSSLSSNLAYRHMMRNVLWNKDIEKRQQSYVPVVYFFFDDMKERRKVYECYAPESAGKDDILAGVNSYVGGNMSSEPQAVPDDELKLIDQAFSNMVQESFSGLSDHSEYQERVYTEIFKLWKDSCPSIKQL